MALMLFAQHLIFGEQNPANPLADAVHINDASYSQQASGPDEDTSIESEAIVSEREGVEIIKKTNVA